jgi:rare lipoprotein A
MSRRRAENNWGRTPITGKSWSVPCFLALALLAGCSTAPVIQDSDGFPEAHVVPPNLETIADATPKPEPRSKYGNPPDYEVFGQRYFVLNSATGYKERGRASWYGTKFNGRRTSSGEPYDMFQMTAAHKTLPLPTYVRVTRVSSGKSVIVKVNDRGPFHKGRIIDLSYAAATRLDLLKEGSAEVEVEALDPGALPPPASPALTPARAPPAFLEVATTDDPIYAVALREEIERLGIGAVEIRSFEQGTDVLHRVIAGPFSDPAGLAAARQRLAAEHPEAKPVTN